MSEIKFANQYPAELASSITASSTTLPLKSGHGNLGFPAISQGEDKYFLVVLVDENGSREIIKIVQRATGSDTLVVGSSMADQPGGNVSGRAQEGTTALAVTYTDPHVVENRLTAASMQAVTDGAAAHVAATGTAVHGLGSMSTQAASAVAITGGSAALDNEAADRKIKARNHTGGLEPEVANVILDNDPTPPSADTVPIGTLWIQYVP